MGNGETCLLSPWMTEVCLKHLPSFSSDADKRKRRRRKNAAVTSLLSCKHTLQISILYMCIYLIDAVIISVLVFRLPDVKQPAFIRHILVSYYAQYCAAFARYDYITVYHKHLHINNLCATAATRQRNDCTSRGSHTQGGLQLGKEM